MARRMIWTITNVGKRFFGFVRRHHLLIAVLVLLMAVRVALPFALRPVLADQLSAAINGHVEIGRVQLWLLYGAVALQDVKVFTQSPGTTPVITWYNLYARIHWLDLLKHSLRLAELRLEFPSVDIKRLKNGAFNSTKLTLRTHEQTQRSAPVKNGWTFAVDHLIFRSGDVAFRDYKVGNPNTIQLKIDQLQVTKFTVHRRQYDQPARAELTAHIAGDGNGWRWTVAKFDVQNSHILVLGPARPVNIGVQISAQQLSSSDANGAPIEIRLSEGNGSLTGIGKLRIQPVEFTGKVDWKNLSLPQLFAAGAVKLGKLTPTGHTNGALDLTVENEISAAAASRGSAAAPTKLIRANGRIEIADLSLAAENPQSFAVKWKTLAIAIKEMRIPVTPSTTATGKAIHPMLVQLSRIDLVQPSVQLTRTAEGFVMPSLLSESNSPSPPSEKHMQIEAARFNVNQGQFTLIDRSVQPFYRSQFSNLEASTSDIA